MSIMSLDGYVADEAGSYDWAMPDDEVFGFVNDFERPVGTYLYGRRLYQEMTGWETMDADPAALSRLLAEAGPAVKRGTSGVAADGPPTSRSDGRSDGWPI